MKRRTGIGSDESSCPFNEATKQCSKNESSDIVEFTPWTQIYRCPPVIATQHTDLHGAYSIGHHPTSDRC